MPIVFDPEPTDPLSQGDILEGVPLVSTTADGGVQALKSAKALVITRPCQALRADMITVAAVIPWKLDLNATRRRSDDPKSPATDAEGATLHRTRRLLAAVRDGGEYADYFYLGNLDLDKDTRFVAQLSTLATVQVPTEKTARASWIHDHRRLRLRPEFLRDLHVRVFIMIARLGFDDHDWYPSADLEHMITVGKGEVARCQSNLAAARQVVQVKAAAGEQPKKEMVTAVERAEIAFRDAESALQPYLDEAARRSLTASPATNLGLIVPDTDGGATR